MTIDFTHQSYRELLAHLRGLGYSVIAFRDVLDEERYVILRHDIDFSLKHALTMARLDHDAGVTSTFFILLTAPYFNVLQAESAAQIRAIKGLGHEIGLHIDLTGFDALHPEQQESRIRRLADVLADVAECEIKAVAQHRPATCLVRVNYLGFIDAYDDRYYREIGYISDSRREFVKPDVYGFFAEYPRSQLLIHPIWWQAEPTTRTEILTELGAELGTHFAAMLTAEDARIEARIRALTGSS